MINFFFIVEKNILCMLDITLFSNYFGSTISNPRPDMEARWSNIRDGPTVLPQCPYHFYTLQPGSPGLAPSSLVEDCCQPAT